MQQSEDAILVVKRGGHGPASFRFFLTIGRAKSRSSDQARPGTQWLSIAPSASLSHARLPPFEGGAFQIMKNLTARPPRLGKSGFEGDFEVPEPLSHQIRRKFKKGVRNRR